MAEDLSSNLQSYQLQLQQVDAALTNEPDNDELLKLKKDLEEVILLTTQLISAAPEKPSTSSKAETSSKSFDVQSHRWKIGEKCRAPWSEDGEYYDAVINSITPDGQCAVTFQAYGNYDVVDVEHLKPVEKAKDFGESSSKTKRQLVQAQKEYKKKKQQKKQTRMKELEEEREKEKDKWNSFNSKTLQKKGHMKKSIFATPDNINGRVGIGTCGIGGKPMTEFQHQEKWKKGTGGPLAGIKAQLAQRKF